MPPLTTGLGRRLGYLTEYPAAAGITRRRLPRQRLLPGKLRGECDRVAVADQGNPRTSASLAHDRQQRVESGRSSPTAFGHNQTVALTSQFAGKQPLTRRPAPGDRRPPSGGPLTHWKAPPYHGARQQRSFDCRGTG